LARRPSAADLRAGIWRIEQVEARGGRVADGDGSVRYFAGLALAFGVGGALASIPLLRRGVAAAATDARAA